HADIVLELDRARAIEIALENAGDEDLVLIAGKGHERVQIREGATLPFSDGDVAIATLRANKRGKRLQPPHS
ncbi:MAG: UDP-N-acetylmuramoyl-L-alanyl-D-glutamate--2,6-diaminopimelate ligase, partial [Polyangiaceae bacterium]